MPLRSPIIVCAFLLTGAALLMAQQGKVTLLENSDSTGTSERTMSESGQFIVYGPNGLARSSFTNRCQDLRKAFNDLLGLKEDDWHYRIVVQVHEPKEHQQVARQVVPKVYPLETGGYRIQLDVLDDGNLNLAEFRRELLRLVIMEQMIHPHQEINPHGKSNLLPDWIVYGAEELVVYRMEGRPSDVFTSLVEAQEPPTLQELLDTDPNQVADSVTMSIYRACAGALVQALLEQKQGKERFLAYIQDLAVEQASEMALLQRHFGALRSSGESLDKWWALQLALMSQRTTYEFLSLKETEEGLEAALVVRLEARPEESTEKKGILERVSRVREDIPFIGREEQHYTTFESGTVRDFDQFVKDSRTSSALHRNRQMLAQINHRAHPLYRQIITRYDQVLVRLAQGKTDRVAEDLADLEKTRISVTDRMTRITDYMNWYDTTQIDQFSGAFDRYESTLEQVEQMEEDTRQDPLSRYLDEVERELK